MPLPSTVGDGNLAWSYNRTSRCGPFVNGTNIYVVMIDATNNQVEVWKSTDTGETWTEQDTADKPSCSSTASLKTVEVFQSGITLHCAYPSNSADALNIKPFDMSTDQWGTAITGGPVIQQYTGAAPNPRPLYMVRRSDGNYIVFYYGAAQSIMGTNYARIKIHRWTGAAWSGPFDVVGSANNPPANTLPGTTINYWPRSIALGASDRVHLIWDYASSPDDFYTRTFLSSNQFATIAAITNMDTEATLAGHGWCVPITYVEGSDTKIAWPWADLGGDGAVPPTTAEHACLAVATSADALTFARLGISDAGHAPHTDHCWGAVVRDDTTLNFIWRVSSPVFDIYVSDQDSAGAWDRDRQWKDLGAVGSQQACLLSPGHIGVVYEDSGIKFDIIRFSPIMSPLGGIFAPI